MPVARAVNIAVTVLNTEEAADYLGVKPGTLELWRWRGNGPLFSKVGRLVRYRISDLDAFMESRTRTSTSDQGKVCA